MRKIIIVVFCFLSVFLNASQEDVKFIKLLNEYINYMFKINPELPTSFGVNSEMGYKIIEDKLTIQDERVEENLFKWYERFVKKVNKLDVSKLSKRNKIDRRVLLENIVEERETREFRNYPYIINQMFGFHTGYVTYFTDNISFRNKKDIKNYLKKVEQFSDKMNHLIAKSNEQIRKGIIPPSLTIAYVENSVKMIINDESKSNHFFDDFSNKIKNAEFLNDNQKQKFLTYGKTLIEENIISSYKQYMAHLHKAKQFSNDTLGLHKLPKGNEYYLAVLKSQLNYNISPEEIHILGLREVARIQNEMMILYKKLGYDTNRPFAVVEGEWWRSTKTDEFTFSNDENGKKEALKEYKRIINEAKTKLPYLFNIAPVADVKVKQVPPYMQGGAGAFYTSANLDGTTEPTFFVSMHRKPPNKKGMQTLAYHEAIPGHHFQIAIDNELNHETIFPAFSYFTSYTEGWALYSEKLAKENNWYYNDDNLLSHLNSELFRAVRLVLDTGIHYYKWDMDVCKDYMKANLGWNSESEILRYAIWPGQACAYKIGELKILEMRQKAKNELKEKFDIKEFHDVIVGNGEIPLYLLEELVDEYIDKAN